MALQDLFQDQDQLLEPFLSLVANNGEQLKAQKGSISSVTDLHAVDGFKP